MMFLITQIKSLLALRTDGGENPFKIEGLLTALIKSTFEELGYVVVQP